MADPVDPDPIDPAPDDERRAERLAEAIADETPRPGQTGADEAASPLYRRMAMIADAAAAFRGAFADSDAGPENFLFAWGPLHVKREIGEGSFGQVYAAWDTRLQRDVALKLRRGDAPGSARRWLDEARALAAVRHPNVLLVHGADEHDGRMGLWTDLIEGSDLETILSRHGPFSAREAVAIGLELSAALAAVHARRLVHGDVKTRNVMRQEGGVAPGRIVLMDFGSAHDAALAVTAGRASSVGTPLAMAPEVLRGEPATPASDVYSLGTLLFRLVTGRYPVEAATLDELREKHERRERLPLRSLQPGLPREFVRVVESTLDPDPRRRVSGAAELERALSILLPTPTRRRIPSWAIPAGVALLAILAAVPWLASRRATAPEPTGAPRGEPAPPRASGADYVTVPPPNPEPAESGRSGAATPRPSPLQADATLYRLRAGEALPLAGGGEIEPGDRLYLDVSAPEPIHAYVLDEDGAGAVVVLYPCAGTELRNPLEAGAAHRLPGGRSRQEIHWLVTSAEGHETFLIVLSRESLSSLERVVSALPQVSEAAGLRYARLAEADLRRLRGVTGMVRDPMPDAAGDPGRLSSLARALGARDDAANLWIRIVQVENPRH